MLEHEEMADEMAGAQRAALVVGGGLAGMQASLLLAATGVQVYLVDRAPAIGGHQPLLDKTFPTDSCGLCFMSPRSAAYCPFVECERSDRVSVLTLTEVVGLSGEAGDFSVRLRSRARGVDVASCTGCGRCTEVCPVTVRAEFGGGLEQRKAIYRSFPQAVPDSYVIDEASCTRCGECAKVCSPGAIDLAEEDRERTVHVGAVVLAPGFKAVDGGGRTEYGHGIYPNVLTSIQVERMLSRGGPSGGVLRRPSDGVVPEKIAFIQCVGSRDPSRDRGYCSTICCMYAAKQVALLKGRSPEASVVVFQRDRRAMGKGYERHVQQVETLPGVEYRRSAVGGVKQVPGSKDLRVSFIDAEGLQREESFDLVVLSVGLEPSDGVRELAGRLGLAVNRHGFLESDSLSHERTPLPGVFVAGGGREPMDVADAVAEGAAAAMAAAGLLRVGLEGFGPHPVDLPSVRSTPLPGGEGVEESPLLPGGEGVEESPLLPGEGQGEGGKAKSSYGDVPRVGVLLCPCGGEIGAHLDLPSLAARLSAWPEVAHAAVVDRLCDANGVEILRGALQQHGLNRLVVAACARRKIEERMSRSAAEAGLEPGLLELVNLREQCSWVHPAGRAEVEAKAEAIVAMGVARAALSQPAPQVTTVLTPTALVVGGGAAGMVAAATLADQGVEVWLAEREAQLGGDLRHSAEGVGGQPERELLEGLLRQVEGSERIHLRTGVEVSRVEGHLGDFNTTLRDGDQEEKINHSVVVLATGVEGMRPDGYLLGGHPAVITQTQLEHALAQEEGWARRHSTVAMLLCAGSMEGNSGYCSRTCCHQSVANARRLKELNPGGEVYVLYREMRSYGFFEEEYEAARRVGVVFLRYDLSTMPEIAPRGESLHVTVYEPGLGRLVAIAADALVLAVGVQPRRTEGLAESLGIERDGNGFFVEANVKTRATEAVRPGVFLCGSCQSPRSLADTVSHAKAAAMRALALLRPGLVMTPPTLPTINERICSGCGLCVASCPYGARALDPERNVSRLIPLLCQGCGSCAAVCPNGATQQQGFRGRQMLAVLDAALG